MSCGVFSGATKFHGSGTEDPRKTKPQGSLHLAFNFSVIFLGTKNSVMKSKILKSFKPVVNKRSRVLILGSMPGPEALRKRQYYGFEGNQFWTLIPQLFNLDRPPHYEDRIRLVKKKRIALWDVLSSCTRGTALDSDIRKTKLNPIPKLLEKFPNIKAVFINGKFAYHLFSKNYGPLMRKPFIYMPSTSPAYAAMDLAQKLKKWEVVKKFL